MKLLLREFGAVPEAIVYSKETPILPLRVAFKLPRRGVSVCVSGYTSGSKN